MLNHAMVTSKGEGKRMIKQGGVKLNDVKISDLNTNVSKGSESILKVGKKEISKKLINYEQKLRCKNISSKFI